MHFLLSLSIEKCFIFLHFKTLSTYILHTVFSHCKINTSSLLSIFNGVLVYNFKDTNASITLELFSRFLYFKFIIMVIRPFHWSLNLKGFHLDLISQKQKQVGIINRQNITIHITVYI